MSQLVPIKYVQLLLRVVEAQGFDIDEFLLEHHFTYNQISKTQLSAENAEAFSIPSHVSAEQYSRLYQGIIWLLQDECFGLHLKGKVPSGTFRMMCLCIIHCKNLAAAIDRVEEFTRFCRNVAGLPPLPHTPLSFLEDGSVINHLPEAEQQQQSIVALAASMHMWRKFCAWLIGKPLPLIEVHLTAASIEKADMLEGVFNCPIRYSMPSNGFRFKQSFLDSPIIHNEDSLNEFLKKAPYQLSVSHFDESSIQTRIHAIIGNDFSKDFPTIEVVAKQLNMSVRTLRRRMNNEGTNYQQFKDHIRLEAAQTYLKRPGLKINAVAALMGFDEPSAFHRAFKKWSGKTPGEYRNQFKSSQI